MIKTPYKPRKRRLNNKGHPLVEKLFEECEKQMISPIDVAKKIGACDNCLLYKWRNHRNPDLILIIAAFNVLGFELKPVRKKET